MIFNFYTEDGEFKLDYADYLKAPELMARVGDDSRVFVNLGLRILSFDRRWLEEHQKHKRFVEHMQHEREENPIRFYLPHCAGWSDFNTPAHQYINDDRNIYTAMVAPNRWGKTTLMIVKLLVRLGLIECDPKWEIFKDHGVKFTAYGGPRDIALVSYMWDNHRETLWPKVLRKWFPKSIIADYINWEVPLKTTGETLRLPNQFNLTLKACSQPQGAFESGVFDAMGWDEQGVEPKFDGSNARLKTRRKWRRDEFGQEVLTRGVHYGALTPHKVDGRPDTGAGTWLHRLATGEETRGITAKFYQGDLIRDVPDWIYPERQKGIDLGELAEAEKRMDRKRVRQIKSRIYGEWESAGGMVFDEYDEEMHVIDDFEIPFNWCAFRSWDHGRRNPTACVSWAIDPLGNLIIFRGYEKADTTPSVSVADVVRLSGNELEELPNLTLANQIMRRFKEKFVRERYMCDILDSNTFKSPDNNSTLTIGDIYRNSGLTKVRAARGGDEATGITIIKQLLSIDPKRKHIATGRMGAPGLYIMRSVGTVRRAMLTYANRAEINEQGNPSEKPQEKGNHTPDALRYGVQERITWSPQYPFREQGGTSNVAQKKPRGYSVPEDSSLPAASVSRVRTDPFTGYPI